MATIEPRQPQVTGGERRGACRWISVGGGSFKETDRAQTSDVVIRLLPAPGLPARPTSRLKRPGPCQSKQGLLACPILSHPARACAGTPLMIPAPHSGYPGPLPSSARSSRSRAVRSLLRPCPAPTPPSFYQPPTLSTLVTELCRPLRDAIGLPIAWIRCAQLTPPRVRCRFASAQATASTPTPNLNVSLLQAPYLK